MGLLRGPRAGLADGFSRVEPLADSVGQEACRDGRAVIVKNGREPGGVDASLDHQERAQLGVAVLLDHADLVMVVDELVDFLAEWEAANAQSVYLMALALQLLQRLVHRGRRGAEIDRADLGGLLR